MKQKGQASIEFMFLISIAMIYIATVVLPAVEISKMAAEDVSRLAQTRLAAEKLANSIDSVAAASGEAKQTITIFVPENSIVRFRPDVAPYTMVSFEYEINAPNPILEHPLCKVDDLTTPNKCVKGFSTAGQFSSLSIPPNVRGPKLQEVTIMKSAGVVSVTFFS